MKLVIDIPDDYVEEFKIQQKLLGDELSDVIDSRYSMARYSIANGIPLEDFLIQRKEPIDRSVIEAYLKENKE